MNSDYVYENENPPTLVINKDNDDRTEHNKEYYEKYIKDQIRLESNKYFLDTINRGKLEDSKQTRLEKELEILKLQLVNSQYDIKWTTERIKMKKIEIEKQKKFENDLKQIQMEREENI